MPVFIAIWLCMAAYIYKCLLGPSSKNIPPALYKAALIKEKPKKSTRSKFE